MPPEEPKTLHITLHPDGVTSPTLRAVKDTVEIMALCLGAIDRADLTKAPTADSVFFEIKFTGPKPAAEERKAHYTSWLLGKAFHELSKGIRSSLEEAYFYIGILTSLPQKGQTTWGEFHQSLAALRAKANKSNFPKLMQAINTGLSAPLQFDREFLSLQRVRNCLEHRNGVLAQIDLDSGAGILTLALPRLRVFIETADGREVEVESETIVEKGQAIKMQRVTRERTYKLGERITFTHPEFHEIALACWLFAQDLGTKLPKVSS